MYEKMAARLVLLLASLALVALSVVSPKVFFLCSTVMAAFLTWYASELDADEVGSVIGWLLMGRNVAAVSAALTVVWLVFEQFVAPRIETAEAVGQILVLLTVVLTLALSFIFFVASVIFVVRQWLAERA